MSLFHLWRDRRRTACFQRALMHAAVGSDHLAFRQFARAARSGLPAAAYRVGRCYLLGLGVPADIGQALRWLRRSADAGESAAQTQLASLALQGIAERAGLFGTQAGDPDHHTAAFWCRRADTAEAKALLAFILTAGPDDLRDEAAGLALYRDAAAAGWTRGQLGLAVQLLEQTDPDAPRQAEALLRDAAADGIAAAHHLLGMLAESGATGSANLPAAADHYRQAALLGYPAAQARYGFALLAGRGTERDVFAAETWLRRAGLAGEAGAAAVVGYLYARDGELPANPAEATMWLRRAPEAGHVGAARVLGRMLMAGAGIPADPVEAVHWLRLVAESGDAAARFELGVCLAQGIGGPRDPAAALKLIGQAAAAGHAPAAGVIERLNPQAQLATGAVCR